MVDVSKYTRAQCISEIRELRFAIRFERGARKDAWGGEPRHTSMAKELTWRNELIAVCQRLIAIEIQERDALSLELQKATIDAENKRAG